jgi:hypothetical protein
VLRHVIWSRIQNYTVEMVGCCKALAHESAARSEFMFCRAATGVRDENLKARALAGTESSWRNGRRGRIGSGTVASLNFPAPPHNCPRTHRAGDAAAAVLSRGIDRRRKARCLVQARALAESVWKRTVLGAGATQPWRGNLAAPTRSRTWTGCGLAFTSLC